MQPYQFILLFAFLLSTLHAAYKAINQSREQRLLRERELRWRQSEQARLVLDDMEEDELAQAAMLALDWDGRPVTVHGKERVFAAAKVNLALRVGTEFTRDEMLIRDCYDHLFFHFERIAQWIRVDLISVYDVLFPLNYLAGRMAERRGAFEAFLKAYGYAGSLRLLGHFQSWGGELTMESQRPKPTPRTRLQRLKDFVLDAEPLKSPDLDKMIGAKP